MQNYERLGHSIANLTAVLTFIATWAYGAIAFGLTGAAVAWIAAGFVGVAVGVTFYYAWMFLPALSGSMLPLIASRRH